MVEVFHAPCIQEDIDPYEELKAHDICFGADPYVFKRNGMWHLLLSAVENTSNDPWLFEGIGGYTIRTANSIPELSYALPCQLRVARETPRLQQVWAAEIHRDHLYVATSDGDNKNHRIRVYRTNGNAYGPWEDLGLIESPGDDDSWAIDLTIVSLPHDGKYQMYGFWSGWENPNDGFPQNIYGAMLISPTQLGPRRLIASPHEDWCCSVAHLYEGPQELRIDDIFKGMLVTGNASWTEKYSTRVLKYLGGDPLNPNSWKMAAEPLFKDGYGIGHGVMVQDEKELYYIGHRKTSKKPGWTDRKVFYAPIDRHDLAAYLERI